MILDTKRRTARQNDCIPTDITTAKLQAYILLAFASQMGEYLTGTLYCSEHCINITFLTQRICILAIVEQNCMCFYACSLYFPGFIHTHKILLKGLFGLTVISVFLYSESQKVFIDTIYQVSMHNKIIMCMYTYKNPSHVFTNQMNHFPLQNRLQRKFSVFFSSSNTFL